MIGYTGAMIGYTGASHSIGAISRILVRGQLTRRARACVRGDAILLAHPAHLPFHDVFLFSSTREDREAGRQRLRDALDGLAYLKGEWAVLHIGSPGKSRTYRDVWQPMIDTLQALERSTAHVRRVSGGIL